MNTIIIQGIGFIQVIFMVLAFQQLEKRNILKYQLIGGLFFTLHLGLLGAMSGAVVNAIVCITRYLNIKKADAPKEQSDLWLYIFSSAILVSVYFTYQGLYSLLPAISLLINILVAWYGSEKTIRFGNLLIAPLWLSYDLMVLSYPGITSDIFIILSLIWGIKKLDYKLKTS